ncbi:uncharacterized protein [Acropora muricata]|uniref:uncharacterized protein n=1 Tax=Acropora muricata TaxID=159855 RepID=UPI0034E4B877
MTDYTKLTSEVLRLLCQQSSLSITGNRQALISRLKAQQQQSKPTGSRPTSARAKRQKTTSSRVRTAEVTPETEPREEPYDQAAIPPPNASTTGEDPLNEVQPPITVDQITSIVSAIVESKLATLSSAPGRASASTAEPAVNLGDPNSVHQLLSKSGDLAAHVDEKTRKAIVKGAATTAAAAGLPAWLIKILGHWRSDSYQRYIHLPQATILQVLTTMVAYHQNHTGVENLTTFAPWK